MRALERPPARTDEPWRPWLVRVAMNLARDLLRRRRRSAYAAPGCRRRSRPTTTTRRRPTSCRPDPAAHRGALRAARERLVRLPARARGADAEPARGAAAARRVRLLGARDRRRARHVGGERQDDPPPRAPRDGRVRPRAAACRRASCRSARARRSERFMIALSSADSAAMEALLADDVRHLSDGGEFAAAHRPVVGRSRVMRLFFGLYRHLGPTARCAMQTLNGLPGVAHRLRRARPARGAARRRARRRRGRTAASRACTRCSRRAS